MSFQVKLFSAFAVAFCWCLSGHASLPCFDTETSKTELLRKELPTAKSSQSLTFTPKLEGRRSDDYFDSGKILDSAKGDEVHFGALIGKIKLPFQSIVSALKDHNTTKSPSVNKMTIQVQNETIEPASPETHRVQFLIKPFPFVTVEWTERWIYLPKASSALISYDKIDGTSHIKHLCGQIFIKALSPQESSVYLYEEVQASRRSPPDTLEGIFGTLKTLRTKEAL